MNRQGFTLIEVLILIAIIGILAAIGMVNYSRWRASSAVMEGAQQFAQAVSRTRTGAKRANACWQISLVSTSTSNMQYQIKEYSGPTCSSPASTLLNTRIYSMPANTLLVLTTPVNGMSFTPPYGTTDSVPDTFEVQWASNTSIKRTLRITSIFGKVVIK